MPTITVPITDEALKRLKELERKRGIPQDMLAQEAIKQYLEKDEICRDIIKKLKETNQIYILDHDVPLSISKHLFLFLDEKRKQEARKRGIPEMQFEWEDFLFLLLKL